MLGKAPNLLYFREMRQLLPFIFMLLFLAILVGANIYLSRRFAWYFNVEQVRPLFIVFISVSIYMILGLALFTNSLNLAGQLLYGSAAFLMGFALYLLLSVIFVDLIHFVVKVKPLYYGLAALFLTLSVSVYGVSNAFFVRVNQQEIELGALKEEVRLMHWTDIHLGHFRGPGFLKKLVEQTNEQKVDMVLITGDLFDGKIRFGDASLGALTKLEAPAYFVAGNHDGYSGVEDVKNGLREVGVNVLSNQVAREGPLQIIGLNHMLADDKSVDVHANGELANMKSILPGIPTDPDLPSILLHHSPDGIQYANEKGVDLYLTGHTHAGQLFPVTLIGDLIYTYNKGLHDYKGTRIFVGEGAGTFGPPMRVGTHSTITVFTLKPGS